MIPEARLSKLVRGPIRDRFISLEDLTCGGTGIGKPWPSHVVNCCEDNKDFILYLLVWYVVHVGYHSPYPQGHRGVPYHRPCGGALEVHHYQHWLVPVRLQQVEWCSARFQSMDMNWGGQFRGQNPPKDWGHAQVGYVWYICVYPQGLWWTGLGERPGNTGRVWGDPPGLPTPDPILVSGNHGGKG